MEFKIERQNRGARTSYPVMPLQFVLVEKLLAEDENRFFLVGGPQTLMREEMSFRGKWNKGDEFFLELPDTLDLYGFPLRLTYRVSSIAELRATNREISMLFWEKRVQDFVSSICQKLEHLRTDPAYQDFASVQRSGRLCSLAKETADSVNWRVDVVSVGLGFGTNDPFDKVRSPPSI